MGEPISKKNIPRALPVSIKIYEAYLFLGKQEELIPTLVKWRDRAISRLTFCMKLLMEQRKPESDFFKTWNALATDVRKDSINSQRSYLDFNLGVGIHQVGSIIAIRPFYECINRAARDTMAFLKDELLLAPFEYWDNVDQPEEVSDEEWNERKKFWNATNMPVAVNWLDALSFHYVMPIGKLADFEPVPEYQKYISSLTPQEPRDIISP
jgi:hypothetical protein